jgi:anti-anti-sigma regulatory factor
LTFNARFDNNYVRHQLAAVLSLVKRMKAIDGGLKFCEMAPIVQQVFRITDLDTLFDIRADEAAGVQAFSE